jgi:hypothetical protein
MIKQRQFREGSAYGLAGLLGANSGTRSALAEVLKRREIATSVAPG